MKISKILFKSKKDKICLRIALEVLGNIDYTALEKLYYDGYIAFNFSYLNVGKNFLKDNYYPQVFMLRNGVLDKVTKINSELKKGFLRKAFREFSNISERAILEHYATNVKGLDTIKKAILLQILTQKDLNILIVSDRDSEIKNEFIESLKKIYPIVSEGTPNDFLGIKIEDKETKIGLIPKADNGILALKDFELISSENLDLLKTAFDKKTIYTKSGKKIASHDTRIKLLATSNTKEKRFVSNKPEIVKEQILIPDESLNLFHIKFFCREIEEKESSSSSVPKQNIIIDDFKNESEMNQKLAHHSENRTEEEMNFIQDYLLYAESFDTSFNVRLKESVVGFVERLNEAYNENKFLFKPDEKLLVKVLIRLAEANAKLYLRSEVRKEDIIEAEKIIASSFLMN
ncbi:hypothetical protein JXM83_03030 [Candidatus Woesearchaeota archaeon]|nr:hypothetical protein [Candidatus Woesearchaeota archaeon]